MRGRGPDIDMYWFEDEGEDVDEGPSPAEQEESAENYAVMYGGER